MYVATRYLFSVHMRLLDSHTAVYLWIELISMTTGNTTYHDNNGCTRIDCNISKYGQANLHD